MPSAYPAAPAATRVHALDAARGGALLLGILFHGLETLTYAKAFDPVQDTQTSALLGAVYYGCHIFRMQAFFLMAGFFAHLLYHRRGPRAFAANRAQRLVVPFFLFWPLDYALVTALSAWSIHRTTGLAVPQALAGQLAELRPPGSVPLMHLWFLYFLILFCLAVAVVRPAADRWPGATQKMRKLADRALAFATTRWWGALALAGLTLWPMLKMTYGFGVDTPGASLWPLWQSFVVYFLYFGLGWLLHRQVRLLDSVRRFRRLNLLFGLALVGSIFGLKLLVHHTSPVIGSKLEVAVNFLYAFAAMASVFAFIGYALAYFSVPNPRIRYLSDSAYWGYLVHLPIVVFFQILVAPYYWHWSIKLFLILGPTFLLCTLTYHVGVRYTKLGLLLNGRIYQRPAKRRAPGGSTAPKADEWPLANQTATQGLEREKMTSLEVEQAGAALSSAID